MQEIKWEKECDVVVAGYGGSGISAAITAHDHGAQVAILEKAPFPGGGQTRTSGAGAVFAIDPVKAAEYLYAASSVGLENADPSSGISVTPREDCLIFMKEMGSICGNIYAVGGLNAGKMLASGRLAGKSAAALQSWEQA